MSQCAALVRRLVRQLTSSDERRQLTAATQLAALRPDEQSAETALSAVLLLQAQLHDRRAAMQPAAAGALASLADASPSFRTAAGSTVQPLVALLSGDSKELQEVTACALCALMRLNPANEDAAAAAGAVPPLVCLLSSGTARAAMLAARSLGALAAVDAHRPAVVAAGPARALVRLLRSSPDGWTQLQAASALHNKRLRARPAGALCWQLAPSCC